MAEDLQSALDRVRSQVLDDQRLVRAIGSGRRKGPRPDWRRVELRYVDLKAGRHLQVTRYDATQAFTANHAGEDVAAAVDAVLAQPFGNWHVESTDETFQLRVTKKGAALVHTAPAPGPSADPTGGGAADQAGDRAHDRRKSRLLPEDDPVLRALGISDEQGRVKPTRQAKYRQVEELLRALDAALDDATAAGALRTPTETEPWRVVDLGCGNAYLTFAALRYLTAVRGLPVQVVGVDTKEQARQANEAVAEELGVTASAAFVTAEIGSVELPGPAPDVVLALHACDTATDDALARAVRWEAPLVLAAPCCHHDVAAQLRSAPGPAPFPLLVRDGILRERFADTLTDALRAGILRAHGYRVDVVEFVESKHTPRNTLLRAVRTGASPQAGRDEVDGLTATWHVRPRLAESSLKGFALVLGSLLGAVLLAAPPAVAAPGATQLFTIQDPAITESSGLVDQGDTVLTINDSGGGPAVFVIDSATGRTVGRTTYSDQAAVDVEAIARGRDGTVWVGDIGDNERSRDHVSVYRLGPVEAGTSTVAAQRFDLVYPDHPRDAETLLVDPETGTLFVVTKGLLGGQVFRAPEQLRAGAPNTLTEVGRVGGLVTDGDFLPDGEHVVLRDYSYATVYEVDPWRAVGQWELPQQRQGEGLSVRSSGTEVIVSSEGSQSHVYEVPIPPRLLARIGPTPESEPSTSPSASTSNSPSPSASPSASPGPGSTEAGSDSDSGDPDTVLLAAVAALALLVVGGAGVVVWRVRASRRRSRSTS